MLGKPYTESDAESISYPKQIITLLLHSPVNLEQLWQIKTICTNMVLPSVFDVSRSVSFSLFARLSSVLCVFVHTCISDSA